MKYTYNKLKVPELHLFYMLLLTSQIKEENTQCFGWCVCIHLILYRHHILGYIQKNIILDTNFALGFHQGFPLIKKFFLKKKKKPSEM